MRSDASSDFFMNGVDGVGLEHGCTRPGVLGCYWGSLMLLG